ncbi:MAG: IclR family transcriptional regulator C-terminal domain-containing protein, partial [Oscillospiraceae bacterium]|nr:IclR family transcriptional regulator C-terminal domain-containing protein [Oscillospiraceae bacterium]
VNDAVGIGAPVFNSDGELAGSIGIIAPMIRINNEDLLQSQLEHVQKFAGQLSSDLGYTPQFSSL